MPSGIYKRTEAIKIKLRKNGKKSYFRNGHKTNLGKHWHTKPFTEEHKNKLRKKKTLKVGEKHIRSEEWNRKNREWHIQNPNRKFRDTSIELKIEAELQNRNINYQKQVPLCKIAIVDFYLPEYRIVIQCDGDYWHNLPKQKERDERQNRVLTFNGFNVYRFWGHEISKSVEKCINKIIF